MLGVIPIFLLAASLGICAPQELPKDTEQIEASASPPPQPPPPGSLCEVDTEQKHEFNSKKYAVSDEVDAKDGDIDIVQKKDPFIKYEAFPPIEENLNFIAVKLREQTQYSKETVPEPLGHPLTCVKGRKCRMVWQQKMTRIDWNIKCPQGHGDRERSLYANVPNSSFGASSARDLPDGRFFLCSSRPGRDEEACDDFVPL